MRTLPLVLFSVLLFLHPVARAAEVVDAWMRAMPPGQPTAAAYVTLQNSSDTPQRVAAARSSLAGRVEFHESVETAGRWQMRQLEDVTVPAGGMLQMQPGAIHIMLFDLARPLRAGDTLDLVLELSSGEELPVAVDVRPTGGHGEHHRHD